ncbi:MAG: luciferase family protein [Bacteroidota bacterium]
MKHVEGAKEKIHQTVTAWEGVASQPHRFGGIEFRFGNRELGHLHGGALLDIPFPRKVRNELVNSGRVAPHHILPESGWVSFYIRQEEDIDEAIGLLSLAFELAKKRVEK